MQPRTNQLKAFLIIALTLFQTATAYLPGVAPKDYTVNARVNLKTNSLTSTKTQLPYDHYSLPFCLPDTLTDKKENLGEILTGSRISNSLYAISFLNNVDCAVLGENSVESLGVGIARPPWGRGATEDKTLAKPTTCTKMYSVEELDNFSQFIKDKYKVNWLLDNMPAAQPKAIVQSTERYSIGFDLGYIESNNVYLNNHVSIAVRYNEVGKNKENNPIYRVVGFEVRPSSVDYDNQRPVDIGCRGQPLAVGTATAVEGAPEKQEKKITWTYSVRFVADSTPWSTRWERYFAPVDLQTHWFPIVNSLLVIVFLTAMVAMILIRTLQLDIRKYSQQLEAQDDVDEKGWKLVYGDVFRTPKFPMLLSVLNGFGVQTLATAVLLLLFAVVGFLSPANRGSLLTGLMVLVVLMGVTCGYSGMRLYKLMKGTKWKRQAIFSALLIPGIVFAIFFAINAFVWWTGSTAAVSFTTLLTLLLLWFGVSVPLVFVGAFFAYKKDAGKHPVGVNPIPRMVPKRVWYMHPVIHVLMGGILPFGAVFIELFFVLGAVWGQKMHYIFTFIAIVFVILVITCAEISVVMCYFQLCSEDYHWWWRSFFTSGATAFYFFAYSLFYFFAKLKMTSFVSVVIYLGYTSIFTILAFVLTGCVGFFACLWFVRKIYSSIPFE